MYLKPTSYVTQCIPRNSLYIYYIYLMSRLRRPTTTTVSLLCAVHCIITAKPPRVFALIRSAQIAVYIILRYVINTRQTISAPACLIIYIYVYIVCDCLRRRRLLSLLRFYRCSGAIISPLVFVRCTHRPTAA